jgi:hypothetical protein
VQNNTLAESPPAATLLRTEGLLMRRRTVVGRFAFEIAFLSAVVTTLAIAADDAGA